MDITPFLHRSLTNSVLMEFPEGRYEGRVVGVTKSRVFNKFKYAKEDTPLIAFEDGYEWIPNMGARNLLRDTWGKETDSWIGRRMAVCLRAVTRVDKESGVEVTRWEKHVEPLGE